MEKPLHNLGDVPADELWAELRTRYPTSVFIAELCDANMPPQARGKELHPVFIWWHGSIPACMGLAQYAAGRLSNATEQLVDNTPFGPPDDEE